MAKNFFRAPPSPEEALASASFGATLSEGPTLDGDPESARSAMVRSKSLIRSWPSETRVVEGARSGATFERLKLRGYYLRREGGTDPTSTIFWMFQP
jgi:hypothetical protein